jgi:hypothetical protein
VFLYFSASTRVSRSVQHRLGLIPCNTVQAVGGVFIDLTTSLAIVIDLFALFVIPSPISVRSPEQKATTAQYLHTPRCRDFLEKVIQGTKEIPEVGFLYKPKIH